ncbi:MAG: DUF2973 domain-containing protein [Cyanobacteriota bacterium]|nr:DUF2973 domain-containing protein [Cyanobacteriota bacterium]
MLQLLYIIAFAAIAFLAIRNLLSNLLTLGLSQQKPQRRRPQRVPHPELIDDHGNLTEEPLLVLRSTTLEDARTRLNELYYESPDEEG